MGGGGEGARGARVLPGGHILVRCRSKRGLGSKAMSRDVAAIARAEDMRAECLCDS